MTFNFPLVRRRSLLSAIAAAPLLASGLARADSRPIEWVVGFAPGGGSDVVARIVADAMGRALQQPIIINNKPGAATNIAADYVARSRDLEHILFTADFATLAANPFLYAKLSYDAERDFTPVGLLVRFPLILVVRPDSPIANFDQFVTWVKAQPQGANYGSPGAGTPHHLAMELLRQRTGLSLTHVPYRGVAPAIQDLLGGQIPFMFVETGGGLPHIQAGKLKPIAVANLQRMKMLPGIPTLHESGLKNFEAFAWQGLSMPSGTPAPTIERLGKALQVALKDPGVEARFQALGVEALPGTPQDMARFSKAERERWGALIRQLGIRLD